MNATLTLSGQDWHDAMGLIVYEWRRGEECLYVGASINGLSRLYSSHHRIGKDDDVRLTDSFVIYRVENESDMHDMERELIAKNKPRYNRANSGKRLRPETASANKASVCEQCFNPYERVKSHQRFCSAKCRMKYFWQWHELVITKISAA